MKKTLKFDSQITEIEKLNPLVSKVLVRIAYAGLNRNNSYIAKDTFDAAKFSLPRCPIVGEYIESLEDFGGHGGKIEITDETVKWVTTTIPYGFIDIDSEIFWEDVIEEGGSVREYLCATGYVWTGRYPELSDLISKSKSHSMEIQIESGSFKEIDGIECYEISGFLFSALCILGDNVEPCFESSSVSAFSLDKEKFKAEFNSMVSELRNIKNSFNTVKIVNVQTSMQQYECPQCYKIIGEKELHYDSANDKWYHRPCQHIGEIQFSHEDKNNKIFKHLIKGGENVNEKLDLFAKFPTLKDEDVVELKNNIDQYSLEELEKKLSELFAAQSNDVTIKKQTEELNNFSLTAQQLEQELRAELSKAQHVDRWGDICGQYWYVDHDNSRVYAEDGQNGYLPVGINYTMTGDKTAIDFDTKIRIKWVPQDMDDQTVFSASLMSIERSEKDFSKVSEKLTADKSEAEDKLTQLKEDFTSAQDNYTKLEKQFNNIKTQYEEINEKYASKIESESLAKIAVLFDEFSKELSSEELAEIKSESSNYTYEEIETKLYALVGKKKAKFSINEKPKHIDLNTDTKSKKSTGKSYDELFEKYSE